MHVEENSAGQPKICVHCGTANPVEAASCANCGGQAFNAEPDPSNTRAIPDLEDQKVSRRWGAALFNDEMLLQIHVCSVNQWIEKQFSDECTLGRSREDVPHSIDLEAFGAVDLGVSRKHAKLTLQGSTIMVQDLGSVNGTYLNGQKLLPFQPRVLRNDDHLQLGRLELRILFMHVPRHE